MKGALSVAEAAKITNVSTATMRRWAASGRNGVLARQVGKAWVIDASTIPIGKPTVRERLVELIESYRGDAIWLNQVPYLVRTHVVDDLQGIVNEFFYDEE